MYLSPVDFLISFAASVAIFTISENLFALRFARGIVKMHYRVVYSVEAFKRFVDDVRSALREDLHRHVGGNKSAVDKPAHKRVFGIARRGKSDLDLFETELDQISEKLEFFVKLHRRYERLIAVAQIDAAPYRRFFYALACRPIATTLGRRKIIRFVFFDIHIKII